MYVCVRNRFSSENRISQLFSKRARKPIQNSRSFIWKYISFFCFSFYCPFFSILATSGLTFITKQHVPVAFLFSIVLSFRILLRWTRIRHKTFHREVSIFLSLQRHTALMNYGQCACFGERKRKSSLPSNGILILTSLLSFAETKKIKKKRFHPVAFSLTAVFILDSKDWRQFTLHRLIPSCIISFRINTLFFHILVTTFRSLHPPVNLKEFPNEPFISVLNAFKRYPHRRTTAERMKTIDNIGSWYGKTSLEFELSDFSIRASVHYSAVPLK